MIKNKPLHTRDLCSECREKVPWMDITGVVESIRLLIDAANNGDFEKLAKAVEKAHISIGSTVPKNLIGKLKGEKNG